MFLKLTLAILFLGSYGDNSKAVKQSRIQQEFYVQVNKPESVAVLKLNAVRYGLRYVEQISPNVHIFKTDDQAQGYSTFPQRSLVENRAKIESSAFRRTNVKDFRDFFDLQDDFVNKEEKLTKDLVDINAYKDSFDWYHSRLKTAYFGMDIEAAWSLNFTGAGVNIGIVDVGFETDHPDLKPNVNVHLAHNFVNTASNGKFSPDYDWEDYPEADPLMDHGNNIAGLIASVHGNNLCGDGVAFKSTIVPLVVFKLEDAMMWFAPNFDPKYIPTALTHRNQDIHIYTNSYNKKQPFSKADLGIIDSWIYGTTDGRAGKGSIFVFSLGDNTDGIWDGNMDIFANSIHTLTIGSIGKKGTVPKWSIPCSCIIASALGDGKTLDEEEFHTTSRRGSCTKHFRGVSAAAGIGSAIIALGLRDRLSWRDVQHLLILTSSLDELVPRLPTTTNAVGLKYNPHFGYGMINATAYALAARTWIPVLTQRSTVFHMNEKLRFIHKSKKWHEFVVVRIEAKTCCKSAPRARVCHTEHVIVNINYTATRELLLSIRLYSPSKTHSDLLHSAPETLPPPKNRGKETINRSWNFTSVQFWGESPKGNWTVVVTQFNRTSKKIYKNFQVHNVTFYIFGTHYNSIQHSKYINTRKSNEMDKIQDPLDILHVFVFDKDRLKDQYDMIEEDVDEKVVSDPKSYYKSWLIATTYKFTFVLLVLILISIYVYVKWICRKLHDKQSKNSEFNATREKGPSGIPLNRYIE